MNRPNRIIVLSLVIGIPLMLLLNGCAVQRTIVRSTMNPILEGGLEAMMSEPNLDIAKTALASNLKLIEGMLISDPHNADLLILATQGFTAYTLAFVEDTDPVEARGLYQRGAVYANRWLIEEHDTDLLAIASLSEFEQAVAKLDDEAIAGIFWLGNAWGSEIFNGLDDIVLVSKLPYVEALMRRVLEIEPGYYFGMAHLFFGGYYGARPPMLGGDLTKATDHIETQLNMTDGQILLGHLFMVKYVHLRQLDEQASRNTLQLILDFDCLSAPENTILLNRVAQDKARHLLDSLEEYL